MSQVGDSLPPPREFARPIICSCPLYEYLKNYLLDNFCVTVDLVISDFLGHTPKIRWMYQFQNRYIKYFQMFFFFIVESNGINCIHDSSAYYPDQVWCTGILIGCPWHTVYIRGSLLLRKQASNSSGLELLISGSWIRFCAITFSPLS